MAYFKKFGRLGYDIEGNGILEHVVNLSSNVTLSERLRNSVSFYNKVKVQDGERMEQLSHRLYGSPDFYWTFVLMNPNLKNLWNDWPKSLQQIVEYSKNKYPGNAGRASSSAIIDANIQVGDVLYETTRPECKGIVKSIHLNDGYVVFEPQYRCERNGVYDATATNRGLCIIDKFNPGTNVWKQNEFLTNAAVSISGPNWNIEFSSVVNHYDAPHHHVDSTTGDIVPERETGTHPISNLIFEEWINDRNRTISVIKPDLINEVAKEFEREISR